MTQVAISGQQMTAYAITFRDTTPDDTMLHCQSLLQDIADQYTNASLAVDNHLLTVTFPTEIYGQIVPHLWQYRIQKDIAPHIQGFTVGSMPVSMPQ